LDFWFFKNFIFKIFVEFFIDIGPWTDYHIVMGNAIRRVMMYMSRDGVGGKFLFSHVIWRRRTDKQDGRH
jgi:hypothetical protein